MTFEEYVKQYREKEKVAGNNQPTVSDDELRQQYDASQGNTGATQPDNATGPVATPGRK